MIFAIISDTHDNIANVSKIINWLHNQKISFLLHCGDICTQDSMDEMTKSFKGEIKFVKGNGDYELDLPEKLELELGGNPSTNSGQAPSTGLRARKIFLNHYPDVAKRAAESGKYDLVFYGHTHKPWMEQVPVRRSLGEGGGECKLINPGETAGQRFKPTFAVYDTETDKLELKILEKL